MILFHIRIDCLCIVLGYSKAAAENALIATGNKGVQPAMDW